MGHVWCGHLRRQFPKYVASRRRCLLIDAYALPPLTFVRDCVVVASAPALLVSRRSGCDFVNNDPCDDYLLVFICAMGLGRETTKSAADGVRFCSALAAPAWRWPPVRALMYVCCSHRLCYRACHRCHIMNIGAQTNQLRRALQDKIDKNEIDEVKEYAVKVRVSRIRGLRFVVGSDRPATPRLSTTTCPCRALADMVERCCLLGRCECFAAGNGCRRSGLFSCGRYGLIFSVFQRTHKRLLLVTGDLRRPAIIHIGYASACLYRTHFAIDGGRDEPWSPVSIRGCLRRTVHGALLGPHVQVADLRGVVLRARPSHREDLDSTVQRADIDGYVRFAGLRTRNLRCWLTVASSSCLTGLFFSRYALLVRPVNYMLSSVNVALFASSVSVRLFGAPRQRRLVARRDASPAHLNLLLWRGAGLAPRA